MDILLHYVYTTLINGFCTIASFIFFLHFLNLKEKYNDKKLQTCMIFYFISIFLQIPNSIDSANTFVWVTPLYFVFQIIFICKVFEGKTGYKIMLFFEDKLLDTVSMLFITSISSFLMSKGVDIFTGHITSTGYMQYNLLYLFIMNLLAIPIKIISALIIEKMTKLLKKVRNLSFIFVPLSMISIFSAYILTYFEFISKITFVPFLFILGGILGILGYILMFFNYNDLKQKTILELQLYYSNKTQSELFHSIDILTEAQNKQKKFNHDYKNQLNALSMLLKTNNYEKADSFINDILETIQQNESYTYCVNPTVNATLNYKAYIAQKNNIKLITDIVIPEETENVSEMDLCSLFSNLLDNAIEAVSRLPEEERYINIKARCNKIMLIVETQNPVKENIKVEKGKLPKTTKTNKTEHGMGLSIIEKIAKQSGGMMEFSCEGNIVKLYVRLILNQNLQNDVIKTEIV